MDKKVTYHEQTDVENTLRLNLVPQLKPEFPMHMTSAFSSSFFWNKIQPSGTGL